MVLDHHVHTQFGDRTDIDAFDVASAAHRAGVQILGFAENCPLPPSFADRVADDSIMPVEDFEHYVDTARGVRAEWREQGMTVLVGTEVDYLPAYVNFIDHLLSRHDNQLDFRLLSVHYIGDHKLTLSRPHLLEARRDLHGGIDDTGRKKVPGHTAQLRNPNALPDDQAADALVRDYYEILLEGVKSGMFDIVGHFDVIKKFDSRSGDELFDRFALEIDCVLDAIAATDHMALELNTSGIDMFCHEPFPSLGIVQAAMDRGIPLTLGSDASSSKAAARHFHLARKLMQRLGVTELAYFKRRTAQRLPVAEWLADESRDGAA